MLSDFSDLIFLKGGRQVSLFFFGFNNQPP